MKVRYYLPVLLCHLSLTLNPCRADQQLLDPRLEPLRPFLDKTWKGEFKNSTQEKPLVDIMHWERALNGKAVRVLHSLNEGAYGGETIFRWDEKQQVVTYHYFTTAGFMTVGSVSFKDGKLIAHEVVAGSSGGVSEVRSESELLPDGTLHVKTEHLKDSQWQPGREVMYKEDSAAKVVFR
jgi:hypothetical protein